MKTRLLPWDCDLDVLGGIRSWDVQWTVTAFPFVMKLSGQCRSMLVRKPGRAMFSWKPLLENLSQYSKFNIFMAELLFLRFFKHLFFLCMFYALPLLSVPDPLDMKLIFFISNFPSWASVMFAFQPSYLWNIGDEKNQLLVTHNAWLDGIPREVATLLLQTVSWENVP